MKPNSSALSLCDHELKCWSPSFYDVCTGRKTFEIRKNDRDYKVGDILLLREWTGTGYTNDAWRGRITYLLEDAQQFGLREGFVVLGIRKMPDNRPTPVEELLTEEDIEIMQMDANE